MKDIHLIKAAQALPFVQYLEGIGTSVDCLSQQVKMPIDSVREQQGVIAEYSVWQFIELCADKEGHNFLGYDCAQRQPVSSLGELGGFHMRIAPTLKMILEHFINDIQSETTGAFYSLQTDNDVVWFRRLPIFRGNAASWQTEQYMIAVIIQIIRLCSGEKWLPPKIQISSLNKPQQLPPEWSDIKIEWGCEATEIMIPKIQMLLPPVTLEPSLSQNYNNFFKPVSSPQFVDFMETQILTNRLSIKSTAEETGLSCATLKRRLLDIKSSYSKLVEQVRFDMAKRLLSQPETPILEVAIILGYEHHSSFTRAFKKMSGHTPDEYRKADCR